ncbi:MAG: SDR family oxidoreductase [Cyclobacteriaceae bacterium]|nr:SDR family oxidoreductase [Cyclobacteriaceae bacterium]
MNVLITGGAGYVGTELTKYLVRNEAVEKVIIYDNLSKNHYNFFLGNQYEKPGKIKFVHGEILDSRLLKKQMIHVDVVVHLAAIVTTPFANTDPHFYEQVNHWGTAEVVYAAEESQISKFIYLSSASVYGATEQPADESSTTAPQTFYGISKLRGEEHVNRLMAHKNALIFRGGNVYGYNRSARFDAVINRFMFEANFKNRIQIFGTGKQSRAFIHVSQMAQALASAVTRPVDSGTYNLVDKNLQVLEILDVLKEIYPGLEFIFSNQHMNLRELLVAPSTRLYDFIPHFEPTSLMDDLLEFKSRLAF